MSQRLRDHIAQLCEELEITWRIGCPCGESSAGEDDIETPPITGQRSYFTALHEIGHVVYGHMYSKKVKLQREAEAWNWALENACVEPNPGTLREIRWCLGNYWVWAVLDGRARTDVPEYEALHLRLRGLIDDGRGSVLQGSRARRYGLSRG